MKAETLGPVTPNLVDLADILSQEENRNYRRRVSEIAQGTRRKIEALTLIPDLSLRVGIAHHVWRDLRRNSCLAWPPKIQSRVMNMLSTMFRAKIEVWENQIRQDRAQAQRARAASRKVVDA